MSNQPMETTPGSGSLSFKLDVTIKPIQPTKNLLAFASVKIADCFRVNGLKIMDSEKGLYVNMPSTKGNDGKFYDTCFPTTKEFGQQLRTAVLDAYAVEVKKVQDMGKAQGDFVKKPGVQDQMREGQRAVAMQGAATPRVSAAPKRTDVAI